MVELSQVSMEMFDDVIGMDKIMNDCPHSAAQLSSTWIQSVSA
jgi:hypothetical protein